MEIVLLTEVKALGAPGAIVAVKAGYARNYLIPNGFAVAATASQVAAASERQQRQGREAAHLLEQADALKQALEGHPLTLSLTLGEGDKAFGSITAGHIADALAKAHLPVERHAIHLTQPIKALGAYEIPIRLHPDINATLKLSVIKA